MARLSEFALIQRLHRKFGRTGPAVVRGIGEDTAIIRPLGDKSLLLTTDLLAEGIHFDLATATFEDVGYKAAVANLSDIAAMGGTPQHLLVSVAIPPSQSPEDIEQLYDGMMEACRPYKVDLVGGDTSASRNGLFLSVTLTGVVDAGRALTRDGARPGDLMYVTGTLGDALAGLSLLSGRATMRRVVGRQLPSLLRRHLISRHLRPTPRIQEGQLLTQHRLATAGIDLSDGLSGDLLHLCERSGVGAEMDPDALPLSAACRAYATVSHRDPVHLALTGGEDYELLFTVAPKHKAQLERITQRHKLQISHIGVIRPKRFGLTLRGKDGVPRKLRVSSYEHFRSKRTQAQGVRWSR